MMTKDFDCPIHTYPEQCADEFPEDFRRDSQTGQCMKEGWVFEEGMYYIADRDRTEALCQKIFGASVEEVYEEYTEDVYYTEWD